MVHQQPKSTLNPIKEIQPIANPSWLSCEKERDGLKREKISQCFILVLTQDLKIKNKKREWILILKFMFFIFIFFCVFNGEDVRWVKEFNGEDYKWIKC